MSRRLTVRAAAERLGVSTKRVYALIAAGKLDAIDVSTGVERPRWRIAEDEIERFGHKSSRHADSEAVRTR